MYYTRTQSCVCMYVCMYVWMCMYIYMYGPSLESENTKLQISGLQCDPFCVHTYIYMGACKYMYMYVYI